MVYMHHQVEMVGHKAPRHYIGIGSDMLRYLFEEVEIVFPRKEYPLAVVALVVDMV